MENKLTYTKQGDYLIPNVQIKLVGPIGKYGMMRKAFLKLHNPMMYEDMVLSETLYPHLKEIDETANKRVELLMQQYQEQNPAPDKKTEQMKWVQYMNTIKAGRRNCKIRIDLCLKNGWAGRNAGSFSLLFES